ncbi:class II fumarate hydratase [Candidatus Foliamicus sp.]
MAKFRTERDSMGALKVPAEALWGASTQRAVENFRISGKVMPRAFIRALGLIKGACAAANSDLGLLDEAKAKAIVNASERVMHGIFDEHFPVDVFQTGSGTSSNMNANEVIANVASSAKLKVHPNDDVNKGQSSNDVIPSALHLSAGLEVKERLLPDLDRLARTIAARADELQGLTKTGRTHLMDAMPLSLGQELSAWETQLRECSDRLSRVLNTRLRQLALGGTAVGTGINAHPDMAGHACKWISEKTGFVVEPADNYFAALAGQGTMAELSGHLKVLAITLMKIANDLRWMNSGPLAGLGEIELPALQPGSSIMPGKVNPVACEAVMQAAAQAIGNDTAITVGAQAGNFQLNVMLPMIGRNALESILILSESCLLLADKAIAGFTVNRQRLQAVLERNPILVTALNSIIGYDKAAAIAKRAYAEGRPILEVAAEETDLSKQELKKILDPATLTQGGIPSE